MNVFTARTALMMIRQHFRNLGLTLPAKMVTDLGALDTASGNLATLRPNPRALGSAILDALTAADDPATDTTVRTELARQQLAATADRLVGDMAEERRNAILTAHAPGLLAALTPVIDAADKALTTAREQIGDQLDLTDAAITGLRPAQMAAWGAAREHAGRVELAAQCWAIVAQHAGLAHIPHDKRPLVVADLTAEQLGQLGHRPQPRAVIAAGHRLNLASPDEFTARCERVDQQRQQAANAGETAQRNAVKVRHGSPGLAA